MSYRVKFACYSSFHHTFLGTKKSNSHIKPVFQGALAGRGVPHTHQRNLERSLWESNLGTWLGNISVRSGKPLPQKAFRVQGSLNSITHATFFNFS